MIFKLSKNYLLKDYCLILLFTVIIYWPVAFMVFSLKNDAINYFLAVRYNLSDSIQNGIFPFWSPFINLGYPLHGDMQSGVWNPLVLLLSAIRRYDIYWLHLETILVIFIGGISMYHLLKFLRLDKKIVLAVTVAYLANGYIVASGQFLNWLYAAAYLPLVFLFVLKTYTRFDAKDSILLGVALSLMFLSAYPADFILTCYLIFFFVIASLIKDLKQKELINRWRLYIKMSSIAAVTFIIISLPAILSYIEFLPLIERGKGLSLNLALTNSLAPSNLISFVLPWVTMKGHLFSYTDPLERNCYIGLLLFLFFLLFLLNKEKNTFTQKFLVAVFIFSLIFSLGSFGGLREIAFHTLPLMNTFRHPANARLFFIFAAQILSAFALQSHLFSNKKNNVSKIPVIIVLTVLTISFSYGLLNNQLISIVTERDYTIPIITLINEIRSSLLFADLVFINSIITLSILLLAIYLYSRKLLYKHLLKLIFLDVFISAQFMLPLTYFSKVRPSEVQEILNVQPKDYPPPNALLTLHQHSENGMKYFDKIGCLNPFNKLPGRADYIITPSNLSTQTAFWNSPLKQQLFNSPLAYLVDTIIFVKDSAKVLNFKLKKNVAFVTESFKNYFIKDSKLKTVAIKKFHPNNFVLETYSEHASLLVLQQNYYPRWKALVNSKETNLIHANISFMGVWLPAGKNQVTFNYDAGFLTWIFVFSYIFGIGITLLCVVKNKFF